MILMPPSEGKDRRGESAGQSLRRAVPDRAERMGILAFRHPLAGCQFVKGTLEHGEHPGDGARRELLEESGIAATLAGLFIGHASIGDPALPWYLYAFETPSAADAWEHWTEDGGGHLFAFFWHPIFHQAFAAIRTLPDRLEKLSH